MLANTQSCIGSEHHECIYIFFLGHALYAKKHFKFAFKSCTHAADYYQEAVGIEVAEHALGKVSIHYLKTSFLEPAAFYQSKP